MARSFAAQRLAHQRSIDRRLTAEHRQLAQAVAALVLRARDADGMLPNRRATRSALSDMIWAQAVKPYYIGQGDSPLRGDLPLSPYARLLYDGVSGAVRIQVEQQIALLRRVVRDDEVYRWLTGPRAVREMHVTELNRLRVGQDPEAQRATAGALFRGDMAAIVRPRGAYDAWHRWLDPNGYRLSDRIWRTSIDVRSRIDALLEYHVARGTAAVDIAQELETFLTPGGAAPRTTRPYGAEGSYSARRLARTEITAAAGRAQVGASAANPFVDGIQWRLSASHPRRDICDTYAHGGPNGDGVYPADDVPPYPAHPHCLCSLVPVSRREPSEVVASLRANIQLARGQLLAAASGGDVQRARAMQGMLNPGYLMQAILAGTLDDAIMAVVGVAA